MSYPPQHFKKKHQVSFCTEILSHLCNRFMESRKCWVFLRSWKPDYSESLITLIVKWLFLEGYAVDEETEASLDEPSGTALKARWRHEMMTMSDVMRRHHSQVLSQSNVCSWGRHDLSKLSHWIGYICHTRVRDCFPFWVTASSTCQSSFEWGGFTLSVFHIDPCG